MKKLIVFKNMNMKNNLNQIKMNKHEICVHIKDDEMLQKAKELLEKHGEKVCTHPDLFCFYEPPNRLNWLHFDSAFNEWMTATRELETEITLDQLEGMLKN